MDVLTRPQMPSPLLPSHPFPLHQIGEWRGGGDNDKQLQFSLLLDLTKKKKNERGKKGIILFLSQKNLSQCKRCF
jgi:hypothetical protein